MLAIILIIALVLFLIFARGSKLLADLGQKMEDDRWD